MGLAATTAGLAACGRSGGGPYWRFFTAAEAETAAAICARLIPADDFPSAADAGVPRFIDRQLTGHYRKHQNAYRQGLAAVDEASRRRFQKRFAELSEEQQDEILRELEEKRSEFFTLIRTHTMQGYYGDPRHGGNRDAVSWKMLGLPHPPVRGRLPYERRPA
jgi:gluconate 2-dehydrogenase gamma chain